MNKPTSKQKFHHKHLPTFTRHTKWLGWKILHLYFPFVIHWLTDKYEGRRHHLVVDMIYSLTTFFLLATNLGIGVWYFLYYTPADIAANIMGPTEVVSGKDFDLSVLTENTGRTIHNATVDVYFPKNFISTTPKSEKGAYHFFLGELSRGELQNADLKGALFGNLDDEYTARIVISYQWAGKTQEAVVVHRFHIKNTTFKLGIDFPSTVTYGFPLEGKITYKNKSNYEQKNVQFVLDFPQDFIPQSFSYQDKPLLFNTEQQTVTLEQVPAHTAGRVIITGIFNESVDPRILSGDRKSDFTVSARSEVADLFLQTPTAFFHGKTLSAFSIVTPRLTASLTASAVVDFGRTINARAIVTNVGDVDLQNVKLQASFTGEAVQNSTARAQVLDGATWLSSNGGSGNLALPVLLVLLKGESRIFNIYIPTAVLDTQQAVSQITITGFGYSPDVQADIPMRAVSAETKYQSRVSLLASMLYYGPNGEEIGYGPYPPQAERPTALRLLLRMNNINNPLHNVTIKTQLPPEVEWTGQTSVAAGTTIYYYPENRTVEWHIANLPPQSEVYGGQFEVRFTPNKGETGFKPHLTGDVILTAIDGFTNGFISKNAGPIVLKDTVTP
ncbi:MAG: hypothetical protein A2233_05230 [Candidatus Kerfeldbacteria bacterium RIFOXYA2_FULL_38_24]|nr:MAG: hypothetical protein A2233_05230 [Candidatus Kerfeldbacteria bacterium RIFOXYA2_FULL_38_24]